MTARPNTRRARAKRRARQPQPARLEEIVIGKHGVLIYDGASEFVSFAAAFVRQGLGRGERCLSVVDHLIAEALVAALDGGGVDVALETERGALAMIRTQDYAAPSGVDAAALIDAVRRVANDPRSRRFAGLRLAMDLTWASKAAAGADSLTEIDALFDDGTERYAWTGITAYRDGTFAPATMRGVIRGHRTVLAPDYVHVDLNPIFEGLNAKARASLLAAAAERLVRKGEFYFREGEEAAEVFLLTRGRVAAGRTDLDGRRILSLEIASPSGVFGYASVLGRNVRLVSAQALEDSRALAWDAATIRRAIASRPEVATAAIQYLLRQQLNQWVDLSIIATERLEQRLARAVRRLAQSAGRPAPNGAVIELSLSGHDLGAMIVTTPYTVSRILAGWRRLGIVDARRDRIVILDGKRLAAVARPDTEGESAAG
ncbi:MAG TPA: MEDS domain-containing protein [bacterium]|nr:MEDS domain-containing protein [bacterium]